MLDTLSAPLRDAEWVSSPRPPRRYKHTPWRHNLSTTQTHTSRTVITTKFYEPTNTRGARIKVSTRNGSKFLPFDYEAGWDGINRDSLAKVTADLLQDEYATSSGDTYAITEVEPIGGPQGDVDYWLATYTRTSDRI